MGFKINYIQHESVYATKSAVIASSVQQDYPMEGIGGSQEELSRVSFIVPKIRIIPFHF